MLTAGGLGIEPRYWASKAHVLPLDDPPAVGTSCFMLAHFYFLANVSHTFFFTFFFVVTIRLFARIRD